MRRKDARRDCLRLESELVFGDAVDEVDLVVQGEGPPARTRIQVKSDPIKHQQAHGKNTSSNMHFLGLVGSRCVPERREAPEPCAGRDGLASQRFHQLRQRSQRLLPARRPCHRLPPLRRRAVGSSVGAPFSRSRGVGGFCI